MTDKDSVVKTEPPVDTEQRITVAEDGGGGGTKSPDPGGRGEVGPGDGLDKVGIDNGKSPVASVVTQENQGNDSSVNGKRKRHRRKAKGGRHHRKWKPYNKLTWEERKVLDDREERRACMRREERFASGQPMAPYNTTQFLMEQHDTSGPIIESHARHRSSRDRDGSLSMDSGSEDCDSSLGDDEETFMEREFTEAYESEHAERLQRMTKDELVREYLDLETKNEKLEKSLRKVNELAVGANNNVARLSMLESEIIRLKHENSNLLAENDGLKSGMTVDNPGAASA